MNAVMKRDIIPYNPHLKKLARKLRQTMTFSEVKMWNELKQGQMLEYDFDRQRPILNYIVDFYCKDLKLAIEVDGITHTEQAISAKDSTRQKELEEYGITFLRFDALLVINKVEAAVRQIREWIEEYEMQNPVPESVQRRREKRNMSGEPTPPSL